MPGLETWFEHFVDEDRVLVILNCRDYSDIRAFVRFWDGLRAIARGEEADPVHKANLHKILNSCRKSATIYPVSENTGIGKGDLYGKYQTFNFF